LSKQCILQPASNRATDIQHAHSHIRGTEKPRKSFWDEEKAISRGIAPEEARTYPPKSAELRPGGIPKRKNTEKMKTGEERVQTSPLIAPVTTHPLLLSTGRKRAAPIPVVEPSVKGFPFPHT
jgi:hypothetical protein